MENLTIVVPFWNGRQYLDRLLDSLPPGVPVIVVDDHSDEPLQLDRAGVRVIRPRRKGFFSGAVNAGAAACPGSDFLILNQDVWFESDGWLAALARWRDEYAVIGDPVYNHPAWPEGYVQGSFMFIRRDAWEAVGEFNARDYPLWGSTCEWQLRACRLGYRVKLLRAEQWMRHQERERFGSAIEAALARWPKRTRAFLHTPPAVSVIMPCFNYGRYVADAVNSLIGGPTCLGEMPGQSFPSFEIVIVDDASTDGETPDLCDAVADSWKGVRVLHLPRNRGCPGAINAGIEASFGAVIHVCSADDMREPWLLETFYRALVAHPHSAIYGDIRLFGNGARKKALKLLDYDFDQMLYKNPMSAGIMYTRKAWEEAGGYPESMHYGREDWAFNIALGIAGYCGHKVDWGQRGPGLLGRREGHNRSLRNAGREWRNRFLGQLRSLYPQIYEGERPMGCCGGRGDRAPARRGRGGATNVPRDLPGRDGMTALQYVGGNHGIESWWGPVTGQRYRAGLSQPIIYVDARDAPGLLKAMEGRRPVFKPHQTEAKIEVPAAEAARVNPGVVEPSANEGLIGTPPAEAPTEPPGRRNDGELDTGELLELAEAVQSTRDDLTTVRGVGKKLAAKLYAAGIETVQAVSCLTPPELVGIVGGSYDRAIGMIEAAKAVAKEVPL